MKIPPDYKYSKTISVSEYAFNRKAMDRVFAMLVHCMFETNEKNNEQFDQYERFEVQSFPGEHEGYIDIRLRWGIDKKSSKE